jgi:hypothetical protein
LTDTPLRDKDSLNDPLIEAIMTGFKQNARNVTKDIISGIGMYDMAAHLTLYIGLLIALYTVLLIVTGWYQLGQVYGAVGAWGSIGGSVAFVGFYLWLRRKHSALKKKYASLFYLFEKLGVA